jgi:hypothetical protein
MFIFLIGTARVAQAQDGPVISCISEVLPEQTQTITISGSGFGAQSPYTGDSPYIRVSDVTKGWNAGSTLDDPPDFVTLVVQSWTDSQIVIGGFAGDYGQNDWTLSTGDDVSFQVWNAQTDDGPAIEDVTVGSSEGNVCTPACSIGSETMAEQPPNRRRKILGVGEAVALKLNGGDSSTTWQLQGPGILSPQGQKAIYMADDGLTGVATITATADTCAKPVTTKLKVIAPSKVTMTNPQNGYSHTQGRPDIGFQAQPFIGPDTVSFYNIFIQEVNVAFTGTGVYAPENGELHCGSEGCPSTSASKIVVSGLGTELPVMDCVYSGDPGTPPPFSPGSIGGSIPWQWFLEDTSPITFRNVVQVDTLESDAKTLKASKAGVIVTESVGSPDGTVTCQTAADGGFK